MLSGVGGGLDCNGPGGAGASSPGPTCLRGPAACACSPVADYVSPNESWAFTDLDTRMMPVDRQVTDSRGHPSATPPLVLVLLKGQPGTGKSTLAEGLARMLGWELIVRDNFKVTLAVTDLVVDEIGAKSYRLMWSRALRVLESGRPCICDANLSQPSALTEIDWIVTQTGAQPVFIECLCSDPSEHQRRLDERKKTWALGRLD